LVSILELVTTLVLQWCRHDSFLLQTHTTSSNLLGPSRTCAIQSFVLQEGNHLSFKKVPFLSVETRGNGDLWRWAFQIVSTRSFDANDGSGDLRIVPMSDLVNHGTQASVEYTYDSSVGCLVQATKYTPAGSSLCMTYADPTNPSYLLAKYGFLDESSPKY